MMKSNSLSLGAAASLLLAVGAMKALAQPVTDQLWQEAVISVTDLDRSAEFFRDIGGYAVKWRGALDESAIAAWGLEPAASGEALVLAPAAATSGYVRLVRFDNAGRKEPMRPGARAWDTGCYFSLMIRMKDMRAIYDDAIRLGWWSETTITALEFDTSRLNVIIFRGPDGLQIQGYERLEPPLPVEIPPFERLTRPFNMMQMVRDRDATYAFFTEVLGFASFYKGDPYVDEKPRFNPLGIPVNLSTSVRYRAGIVYPVPGEFGRMEMIEIMDLDGHDYSDRCVAPNLGILAVRFPVNDVTMARHTIIERGASNVTAIVPASVQPYGELKLFGVSTPDGGLIQFYAPEAGKR
jgi:catechol 2,3-dioxygenase-like lactoylglutathione lyase family enzyme